MTVDIQTTFNPVLSDEVKSRIAALRKRAARSSQSAYESFERCDTDGFLSQAASQEVATACIRAAQFLEKGSLATRKAFFDLDGNFVPTRSIETEYGISYMRIDPQNPTGPALGWVNESKAVKVETYRKNMEKKGLTVGFIQVQLEVKERYGVPYIAPQGALDVINNPRKVLTTDWTTHPEAEGKSAHAAYGAVFDAI